MNNNENKSKYIQNNGSFKVDRKHQNEPDRARQKDSIGQDRRIQYGETEGFNKARQKEGFNRARQKEGFNRAC